MRLHFVLAFKFMIVNIIRIKIYTKVSVISTDSMYIGKNNLLLN